MLATLDYITIDYHHLFGESTRYVLLLCQQTGVDKGCSKVFCAPVEQ